MTDDNLKELDRLTWQLRGRQAEREAKRRAARREAGKYKPRYSLNQHLAEIALVREPIDEGRAEIWVTYTNMREDALRLRELPEFAKNTLLDPDALNGYVAFSKRSKPRLPITTGDLVKYIPVHGGVTYAHKDSYAAVWGFDTFHVGSEKEPRTDCDWVRANCWILYRGLLLAAKLWPEFQRANRTRKVQAELVLVAQLAEQLLALLPEQPMGKKLGFEAMIGLLAGEV
jgi:hypothetical protein